MGIKGLAKFLSDQAPKSVRQQEFTSFTGRIIAIDASMSLYQFMVAIREGDQFTNLTNQAGETTSHISGMLARSVRLMEHGIKPVYVFDGKPPTLKTGELALRKERRDAAEKELEIAVEAGDQENIKKYMGRTVKVTKQHNEDVKKLFGFMGIPVVEAPCEAEAQCARLCAAGKVFATATEDADALTFGSTNLIKNLNFSAQKDNKTNILIISLPTALTELEFSMEMFVDFCILCGCDYTDAIKGIGSHTAYKLVKEYKDIETILEKLDKTKYKVPETFPYQEARNFFVEPEITEPDDIVLQFKEPDYEGLKKFLVDENSFSESRVDSYIARLKKAKDKGSQMRLENFFGSTTMKSSSKTESKAKGKAKSKSGKESSKRKSENISNSNSSSKKPKTA